jgi:hypothetical protein
MTTTILIAAIALLTVVAPNDAKGQESAGFSAVLRLSVNEFDPSKPAGTIACWVKNESDKEIVLPAGYGTEAVILHGGSVRLWHRGKSNEEKKVTIKPGQQEKVFDLSLAEILATQMDRREWGWTWDRRPEPPKSPIHKWRKPGYEETTSFFVEVKIDSVKTNSEPVKLKVKDSSDAAK